jgi:hypothetical protein
VARDDEVGGTWSALEPWCCLNASCIGFSRSDSVRAGTKCSTATPMTDSATGSSDTATSTDFAGVTSRMARPTRAAVISRLCSGVALASPRGSISAAATDAAAVTVSSSS